MEKWRPIYLLTGLVAIVLLGGAFLFSIAGGARGWPFFAVYLPASLALAISVRLPLGDHRNAIESSVEGQGFFPAYVIPIASPAIFYAMGWLISFIVRLLNQ